MSSYTPNFQASRPVNNNFGVYAINYKAGDCLLCNCCPHVVAWFRYVCSLPVVMRYIRHLAAHEFSDRHWTVSFSLTHKSENLDIKLIWKIEDRD